MTSGIKVKPPFPILQRMPSPEKIVLGLCLLVGFLWLRARSRSIDLESQMLRALLGTFVFLPGALIGEKYFFEMFRFGGYVDILLKAAVVIATFLVVGFGFLKSRVMETVSEQQPKDA